MKKQAFNPYLPEWEYIPDGEPYVFDGRVYIFGSHDRFGADEFCLNNYIGWSAPTDDLANWECHGYIYDITEDPLNEDGKWCGFAPDVAKGPDGRYYLFYGLNNDLAISVAVCDTPAGRYHFYGHVKLQDGRVYGTEFGDVFCFDPGVLVDDDGKVHLYIGFSPTAEMLDCNPSFISRISDGAYHVELDSDMLTIKSEPTRVVPGPVHTAGTGYEGHGFFEASSIRKIGDTYYFIYSSENYNELCYATGNAPEGPFTYGGTLVSGVDLGYNGNTVPLNYSSNNHGSIECINGKWYVFYHRHTNKTMFSRQACAEPLTVLPDGKILQSEVTSCGLNGGALIGCGEYKARIACNLTLREEQWFSDNHPYFTQSGEDREGDGDQYITNMKDGAWAGFKYFEFDGTTASLSMTVRSKANGKFIVTTKRGGDAVCEIEVSPTADRAEFSAPCTITEGIKPLYFTYEGEGEVDFFSFKLS